MCFFGKIFFDCNFEFEIYLESSALAEMRPLAHLAIWNLEFAACWPMYSTPFN